MKNWSYSIVGGTSLPFFTSSFRFYVLCFQFGCRGFSLFSLTQYNMGAKRRQSRGRHLDLFCLFCVMFRLLVMFRYSYNVDIVSNCPSSVWKCGAIFDRPRLCQHYLWFLIWKLFSPWASIQTMTIVAQLICSFYISIIKYCMLLCWKHSFFLFLFCIAKIGK